MSDTSSLNREIICEIPLDPIIHTRNYDSNGNAQPFDRDISDRQDTSAHRLIDYG